MSNFDIPILLFLGIKDRNDGNHMRKIPYNFHIFIGIYCKLDFIMFIIEETKGNYRYTVRYNIKIGITRLERIEIQLYYSI